MAETMEVSLDEGGVSNCPKIVCFGRGHCLKEQIMKQSKIGKGFSSTPTVPQLGQVESDPFSGDSIS
jgi:hypothetical protein